MERTRYDFDPDIAAKRTVAAAYAEATFHVGIFKSTIRDNSDFGSDFAQLVWACDHNAFANGKPPDTELKTAVLQLQTVATLPDALLYSPGNEITTLLRQSGVNNRLLEQVSSHIDSNLSLPPYFVTRFVINTLWEDIDPQKVIGEYGLELPAKYKTLSRFTNQFCQVLDRARKIWQGHQVDFLLGTKNNQVTVISSPYRVKESTIPTVEEFTEDHYIFLEDPAIVPLKVERDHRHSSLLRYRTVEEHPKEVTHRVRQLAADIGLLLSDIEIGSSI